MKKQICSVAALGTLLAAGAAHADPVRLSHSTEEFLVTGGTAIACSSTATPQTSSDNQYWRSFTLSDFGVSESVTISDIELGIENILLPTLVEVDVTVRLFQAPGGSAPAFGLEEIGSTVVTLSDRALEIITVDVSGVVDAGNALIVQVDVPNLQTLSGGLTGDVYFPGANSFGQSAPSYISSTGCSTATPTDYAVLGPGFPDVHLIIIANGETGGTGCRADLDGDGSLTIFDFLTFQNLFDAGDLTADFDGDGSLTIFDFLTFQNEFDAGC
ncbi:MAG: GC-type dockerin domain-anchored protein [Phycisphaerales bacterium JB064]